MGRRGIIAAVSPEWVIGVDGTIPWHYSEDLKRFKRLTLGHTIVMGRRTWESIGARALPRRRNIVITSQDLGDDIETYRSLSEALAALTAEEDVWFIGGHHIFREAMEFADFIDLTYVPDHVAATESAVVFPPVDDDVFEAGPRVQHERDPQLQRQVFTRRKQSANGASKE